MRFPRLTVDSDKQPASYHVVNRIAGGLWLLGDVEKEVLRRQIWATAAYCGLKVITYAIMSNHHHVLVTVPQRRDVSDKELLRRYRAFHPRLNPQQKKNLDAIEADMVLNGPLAQNWRKRQLRQMFDISRFGALLDQRFSIWYNRRHNRKGTLWMGRFRSVLVEDGDALRNMALYIDMNACRAGIVSDPKNYRFCGYAEAIAGMSLAREGLQEVFQMDWSHTAESYRAHLLAQMHKVAALLGKQSTDAESNDERLAFRVRVGCRIRYFVEGVILGSADFVSTHAAKLPGERKRPPRALAPLGLAGELCVMGRLIRSDCLLA